MRRAALLPALIPALAVLGLLASACGGGGGTQAPPASSAPTPPPSLPPPPSPPPPPPRPPSPPAASTDVIWGANGHPFRSYPDISFEQQLDTLVGMGVKQYRVDLGPDGSPAALEQLYNLAQARGITLLPIILPDISFDRDSADTIYQKSRTLAETLARRFAGRIKVWELGNEYENYAILLPCEMRDDGTQYPCSWGPASGVGSLDYAGSRWRKVSAALDGMSDGVRVGDPGARRAMGTAGWGHTGAFDRMKADGIEWEISVWHQYQPTDQDVWAMEKLATLGKPIWITEFNHPFGSRDGEAAQAQGVVAMMAGHRNHRTRYRVEASFMYELLDEPYWTNFEAIMGLHHVVKNPSTGRWMLGQPKLAYGAVKQAIQSAPGG